MGVRELAFEEERVRRLTLDDRLTNFRVVLTRNLILGSIGMLSLLKRSTTFERDLILDKRTGHRIRPGDVLPVIGWNVDIYKQ